jgi:hypothetical protein
MSSKIGNYQGGSPLAVPLFSLALALAVSTIARPALADGATSSDAARSQADSGYWTAEKMRSAKPMMPAVPGTPEKGPAVARPVGPTGGSPGQGPEAPGNGSERQE